jgi:ribonucleoside-triphosphate reductase|nr:MAG TPA: anaerobic ribonucleoside triphosphate reductase [Caudoviricetes sp.]
MNEQFGEKVKAIFDSITVLQAKDSDLKRDNANINGDSPMGAMLQYGANTAKEYNLEYLVDPEIAKLHRDGWIHIHDLDFYAWTTTCTQIELRKLFKNGFNTGHGHLRAPKSIGSYAALAAIAIQSNQNDQHGGQSVVDFDYAMAEGVRYTYQKYLKEGYAICERLNDLKDKEWILDYAMEKTTRDTYQAMEGLVHNLNTMHSRAGAQVPFSSINYGTDTSWEGRLAIEQLLLATEAGLGNGETPIFPIQIFRVKEGVNYNPDDPNYDLFELAMKVSAKRLFPNFAFIDAPFNLQYYKPGHPETEVAYMGCRTRVMGNVYDPSREIAPGRGNLSFTSINLPRLGIESKGDYLTFFKLLDKMLDATMQQLLDRYKIQASRVVRNFPFLMGEGVWMDSDGLSPDDTVGEVLKHGTLSIGFCGLAECLVALNGKHHGEDEFSQELGLRIVGYIRDYCNRKSIELGMNVTCLATPAESLAGRLLRSDRERYGIIKGVTDREYYTNSFHVPVYYHLPALNKIDIEAPYHALTNAGHISYVELDGDPTKNLAAFERVVRHMKEAGIGYGSINHPVDRDPVCGYNGIINDTCPCCGRSETDGVPFERIRRITGYLVGTLDKWNDAKRAEERDRVKHEVDSYFGD